MSKAAWKLIVNFTIAILLVAGVVLVFGSYSGTKVGIFVCIATVAIFVSLAFPVKL